VFEGTGFESSKKGKFLVSLEQAKPKNSRNCHFQSPGLLSF